MDEAFDECVTAARIGLEATTVKIELPSSPQIGVARVNNDQQFAFAVEYLDRAIHANYGEASRAIAAVREVFVSYKERCDVSLSIVEEKFPEGDLKNLLILVLRGQYKAYKILTSPLDK